MIKKSFALISAIILIVWTSIAVLGLSFFIIGNLEKLSVQESVLKSVYLAEAGVHRALYFFRENGFFSLGEHIAGTNEKCVLSGDDAGLLIIDVSTTELKSKKNSCEIEKIFVRSAVDSRSPVITDVVVTWDDGSLQLKKIEIGKSKVWQGSDPAVSPANCDISDTDVDTDSEEMKLEFVFDEKPSSLIVSIMFITQDSSSKEVEVYPASAQANFTFQSTGSAEKVSPPAETIIESEYNSIISEIVGCKKIQ
ncbi:MAG: hypothetical protein ABIH08_02940 [Candidatus Omnitrophota bacterium]